MATIDIAMESTSQAILNKFDSGIETNTKVPIKVYSTKGSTSSTTLTTLCSVTGKGSAIISGSANFTIVVDGVTVISDTAMYFISDSSGYCSPLTINFTKSFVLKYRHTSTYGTSYALVNYQVF